MRKAIASVVAVTFLSGAALALTPAPASAFVQFFFVPALLAKEDKNFKAVNPYDKPVRAHHRHSKKRM